MRHFFFDLDKTLTTSRSPMDPAYVPLFDALCRSKDVVVVSGGSAPQIRDQVGSQSDGLYWTLAQSGNHALDPKGGVLWEERLSEAQTEAILAFIEVLKRHFGLTVRDESDLVEHRGAQISYNVIGFHEDPEKKYAFDPGDKKRAAALAAHPKGVRKLRDIGIEASPAGTATFNFILLGRHKGYNITRLLEREGWHTGDCIYVGDALFPGGNDESVIGVIETHAVENPEDTFRFIQQHL